MSEKPTLSSNYSPDEGGVPFVVLWRTAVYNSARLSRRAKYVAFLLSMRMDADGYTFVGAEELAHRGRYGREAIGLGLRELRKSGYLKSRRVYQVEIGFRYDHWARLPGDRDTLPERHDPFDGGTTNVFGGG